MVVVLYLKVYTHSRYRLQYVYRVVEWWMIVVLHLKEHIHTVAIYYYVVYRVVEWWMIVVLHFK